MVDCLESVDSDPVELRAQAVVLEHSASVLTMAAEAFGGIESRHQDPEIEAALQRAILVFSAAMAGIGDGVGDLGALVRLIASDVDPSGETGSEDEEATHPRRRPEPAPPNDAETTAQELLHLAEAFGRAASPLSRQRTNLLSAAAALVTQLPAEQLPRFVYLSSRLGSRVLHLIESLGNTESALTAFAGTVASGRPIDACRAALLQHLVDEPEQWLPRSVADAEPDGLRDAARAYAARPTHVGAHHPAAVTVHDSVIPVDLSDR